MAASITFWMSNAGFPILMFLVNIFVRLFFQLPITAAADWVFILVGFDIVAMNNQGEFSSYVTNPIFRESWSIVFTVMIILGFCFWLYCVWKMEPALEKIRIKGQLWGWREIGSVVIAISLAFLDTWAHYSILSFSKIS